MLPNVIYRRRADFARELGQIAPVLIKPISYSFCGSSLNDKALIITVSNIEYRVANKPPVPNRKRERENTCE